MEYTIEYLVEKYGEEVGTWVYETLEYMISEIDDSCVDNERYCDLDEDDRTEYDSAVAHGCCGFVDEDIRCPINGHMFKLGFNYGH